MDDDTLFLGEAIQESKRSVEQGGFPVGCVIVSQGKVIARGISDGKQLSDPTSHAEIATIREICEKRQGRFLTDCTLYASCEPCLMCFVACVWARIPRVVYTCKRSLIPKNYFEGDHNINQINESLFKRIELVYYSNLEAEALKVIDQFER